MRTRWTFCFALVVASGLAFFGCGSTPAASPPDGGSAATLDGGAALDGGASVDGGPLADGGANADGGIADGGAASGGDGGAVALAAMKPYSAGTCPSLAAGTVAFRSGNRDRTFLLFVPSPRSERPGLLMLWHGLGDSARNFANGFDAQAAADRHNLVIAVPTPVLPSLTGSPIWSFLTDFDVDLTLFDDIRTCAAEKLSIDAQRVYTMGFSAGGLWSTYLVLHRSDAIAAAVIFSGGASMDGNFSARYTTPAYDTPVLLSHGGMADVFGGFLQFQQLVEYLASRLRDDGHYVLPCYHQRGHRLPTGGTSFGYTFLTSHTFGGGRSPYQDPATARDAFPSVCAFP